jgi:hypothetical protein
MRSVLSIKESDMNLKEQMAEAEKRIISACLTCPRPDCEPDKDCPYHIAQRAADKVAERLKAARKRMEHARIVMIHDQLGSFKKACRKDVSCKS